MPSNRTSNDMDLFQLTQYNIQSNRVVKNPPLELWSLPDFTILTPNLPPILIDSIWL